MCNVLYRGLTMARKICKNNRYLAKLVTGERALCAFCLREVDDEVIYGKLYAIGDIQCHYFCCLLSCCLIQKGSDEEGLFGFMYTDILAEIERCKKHKCSYCGHSGANLGCSVAACRKQFHVPCGRGKNAVSLYYGSYKSFCQQHAPKQKIPEHIMAKARLRMRADRSKGKHIGALNMKQESEGEGSEDMLCLICYEPVEGFPTVTTFWPPCCGKDAWFHRPCLQRMALSAGMHYLKCPLCNDKESFYDAVVEQGYYVPDRDAAWELEQNAFAEIYERAVACSAEPCLCPLGKSHDAENGEWDIKLCLLCGSAGEHAQCILQSQPFKPDNFDQSENITETTEKLTIDNVSKNDDLSIEHSNSPGEPKLSDQQKSSVEPKPSGEPISPQDEPIASRDEPNTPDKLFTSLRFVCKSCLPAAPQDLNALASSIEAIIQEEQAASASEARRPVMPSRMSIRRTKRRPLINRPSTSRSSNRVEANNESSASPTTASSRLELNLKPPRRAPPVDSGRSCHLESKLMSPIKLLEHSFKEKMVCTGVRDVVLDEIVVATLRRKFRKPRPMCERKRIIDNMLDRFFDDLMKNPKQKEQVIEWCSPKKCISEDSKVELKYKPIDVLKEIEEFQNKENDSNTFNTPVKDLLNIKVEDNGSDLFNNNDNIVNNAVKYEISNDVKISDLYQNGDKTELAHKENKTEPHTLSNDDENMQDNTEIEDISSKNNESCGVTRHSMTLFRSNNDNDEVKNNYSNETEELIIKTRKSEEIDRTSIPEVMVTKSSENEAEIDMSETDTVKEESKNTENIISGNKNKFAKKSIILKFNYSKGRKSLRGVEKSKYTHNYYKNKIRSKSESSTDITILKRLLTEKELCSQLLRELTTGNTEKNATKDSSRSETQNKYEHQINSNEITKSVNDRSNFLHETIQQDNHSDRLNEPQKSDECTKSPIKITKRSRKVNNMETTTISPRITRHSTENSNSLNSSKLLKQIPKYPNKTEDINKSAKDLSPNPRLSNANSKTEETAKNFQSQILIESPTKLNDTSKLIDIPKHKTIDILQDSSLEISENDQHINIDVIKIEDSPTTENSYKNLKIKLPDQSKTCLKFSPTEEILEKTDIDLERFKKEYLNEVDREFECNFRHKHVVQNFERRRYRSPIDFALNAVMKKADDATTRHQKRKISESGIELPLNNTSSKRRKFSESDLRLSHNYDKNIPDNSKDNKITVENYANTKKSDNKTRRKKIKEKRRKKRNKRKSCREKNIEVTIDSSENGNNKKKKIKTKIAIQNKNFKIKWKKKQLRLNIESKKEANEQKKIKDNHSNFKQYILQFSEGTSKDVLVKPEKEICPLKRMYVKKEKTPDKLKQMSIQSFFKIKSEK